MSRHRAFRNNQKYYIDEYYDDLSSEQDSSGSTDLENYNTKVKATEGSSEARLEYALNVVQEVLGKELHSEEEIVKALEERNYDYELVIDLLLKRNEKDRKRVGSVSKGRKKQDPRSRVAGPTKTKETVKLSKETKETTEIRVVKEGTKKEKPTDGLLANFSGLRIGGSFSKKEVGGDEKPSAPRISSKVATSLTSNDSVVNLIVIGHVDAGKSTLLGHLLQLVGAVEKSLVHKNARDSEKIGKSSFRYAWVLDATSEERSRGVTMDIAFCHFRTNSKLITVLDAPGHRDFVPKMISGATQADAALLVIDANYGEFETGFTAGGQTREHAILARSLGVSQLVVAVNKMDLVGYSEARYNEVVTCLRLYLNKLGYKDTALNFVPCGGFGGVNLVTLAEPALKSWYAGPTLLDAIDALKTPDKLVEKPLRLCAIDVYKTHSGAFIFGNVVTGRVAVGDEVLMLPGAALAKIKAITVRNEEKMWALAGDSLQFSCQGIELDHFRKGSFFCDKQALMAPARKLLARVYVFKLEIPIIKGTSVIFYFYKNEETGYITRLIETSNKSSGSSVRKNPRSLSSDSSALIEITLSCTLYFDLSVKSLSRFTLRTRGKTIAAGLVTEIIA
ncbi:HBS1-like protein [Zophobas morio]|uniref:HBS1-like protein n=1 Tax=Zophobas morio TaxID=2755281 RepID=UPI0030826C36